MKKFLLLLVLCAMPVMAHVLPEPIYAAGPSPVSEQDAAPAAEPPFVPDTAFLADRAALDRLQRDAFHYMWTESDSSSGMVYESSDMKAYKTVAVGGTGFGVAALVTAVDRGWVSRDAALARLHTILAFLRDKTPRRELHGAFPHWLDGETGEIMVFGKTDTGADILETALLMQGLLIARAYFNGPGVEENIRDRITELWEDVEWDWFTNGEDNGLYWHWTPEAGFSNGLKILGFNECHIAYVLAMASPTHPISRKAYDYWTSGKGYQAKQLYGYTVEASLAGGGPLFLTHYSYIGLDPRKMADAFVPGGYFARNVKQVLSNRGYCLFHAPARNKYGEKLWGLTASLTKAGYTPGEPSRDSGTIAPTAALSSMPYAPHYALQVLETLLGPLREKMWGPSGPYDAVSPRDNWFGNEYIAIDQLPIVCMVENYRTGLLWRLLMRDKDVVSGLRDAGIVEPEFAGGFPEAVVTITRSGKGYAPDAYEIRRHPDTGLYEIPFWADESGTAVFRFTDKDGVEHFAVAVSATKGRNVLTFPQFEPVDGTALTVFMRLGAEEHTLPVRLH